MNGVAPSGAEERAALAAVRRVLRGRAGLPTRGDLAYGVYLAIMLTIIAVAPVVRAAILALSDALPPGDVLAGLPPGSLGAAGAVLAGLVALAALAGAQTGPARARLPEIDLLHTGALSRRRLLARPLRRAFLAAAGAGALLGGVLIAALALRGGPDPAPGPAFGAAFGPAIAAGAVGVGLLLAAAMLLGQFGRAPRRVVAGAFGALGAALALLNRSALDWPSLTRSAPAWPAPAWPAPTWSVPAWTVLDWTVLGWSLLGAGVVAALVAAGAAGRLRLDTLREQAVRLGVVGALAISGELRLAAARLGAPVRAGRRWRWRVPRRIAAAILARDLVGIARTPARSLAALAGSLAAGALLGGPWWSAPAAAAAVPGAAAVLLAYAAVGPWCRGLRAAAETVGGSALTPLPPAGLLLRHLVVPGLLAAAAIGGSAALISLAAPVAAVTHSTAAMPEAGSSAAAGVAAALVALLLRLAGALKGPLPQSLLAPVPTPVGDMAGINVLLWSLDGVLVAVLAGGALAAIAAASPAAGLASAGVVLALLALWASVRLRRLA